MKVLEREPLFYTHKANRDDCFRWHLWVRGKDALTIEFARTKSWNISIDLFDEETDFLFGISGFGGCFYLTTGKFFPKWLSYAKFEKPEHYKWTDAKFLYSPRNLKTGISILGIEGIRMLSDWYFNFEFLHCDEYSDRTKWRGISFNLNPISWIFGELKSKRKESPVYNETIKLPESDYPVEVKITEVTLFRSRYWNAQTFLSASVDIPENGKPIPTGQFKYGGPNDRYGSSFPLGDPKKGEYLDKSIDWLVTQAICEFAKDILKDRKKYGYDS